MSSISGFEQDMIQQVAEVRTLSKLTSKINNPMLQLQALEVFGQSASRPIFLQLYCVKEDEFFYIHSFLQE